LRYLILLAISLSSLNSLFNFESFNFKELVKIKYGINNPAIFYYLKYHRLLAIRITFGLKN